MPTVHRLIYASRIAPVCQDDLKTALMDIVTRAIAQEPRGRRSAASWSPTAAGSCRRWRGRSRRSRRLFEKIAADPRHHHALPLNAGPADARLFEPWSLGAGR